MFYLDYPTYITELQLRCLTEWEKDKISLHEEGFFRIVEENHAFNFQLWNAEDRARRDDQGHEFVYVAKREIDHCNQQRNNRMEAMDEWLFNALAPSTDSICPVHSETPGMMIDRLSILTLKSFHMEIQANRQDVSQDHIIKCRNKLAILLAQKDQLEKCLHDLFDDILNKKRTFRVYHQFKMYNDPTLNPELYRN
ncbi:Uncharacterised protein (plasmid) [Legionella adelaidensis]|uniref:DUF4254 domain-containing protein n=1 Tax=Legionella adelaidensis TaxID=45056 RepID=A0A0W0R0Y9_9GAMM|nr:hypothetical protein Lade_2062 [Legionella adelaidensis]VEH81348.1 Uncharacterised protein [Legionella adelaidensis]